VKAPDLGCFFSDRSYDLAALVNDGIYGCCHVVDEDEDEQSRVGCRRPTDHPGAPHVAGSILERGAPSARLEIFQPNILA